MCDFKEEVVVDWTDLDGHTSPTKILRWCDQGVLVEGPHEADLYTSGKCPYCNTFIIEDS